MYAWIAHGPLGWSPQGVGMVSAGRGDGLHSVESLLGGDHLHGAWSVPAYIEYIAYIEYGGAIIHILSTRDESIRLRIINPIIETIHILSILFLKNWIHLIGHYIFYVFRLYYTHESCNNTNLYVFWFVFEILLLQDPELFDEYCSLRLLLSLRK